MKRTRIYENTVYSGRMTDAQYINHLEKKLAVIDQNIEIFVQAMDNAHLNGDSLDMKKAYVENIERLTKL